MYLLLDTNVVINYLKGDKAILKLIRKSLNVSISYITEIELWCYKVDPEDRKTIKEFIDNIDVVYPDAKTIKYSLEIRRKGGLKLSDSMIAALAQQYNLILTTYDPELLKQARSYSALKP